MNLGPDATPLTSGEKTTESSGPSDLRKVGPAAVSPDSSGGESTLDEEALALRWRHAILRLSGTLMDAADERSDLSPILLEALHNALDNLLVYGEADDLLLLEEWLSMEEESKTAGWRRERRENDRREGERRHEDTPVDVDRRDTSNRRVGTRRTDETAPLQSETDTPSEPR